LVELGLDAEELMVGEQVLEAALGVEAAVDAGVDLGAGAGLLPGVGRGLLGRGLLGKERACREGHRKRQKTAGWTPKGRCCLFAEAIHSQYEVNRLRQCGFQG
jgi:hypothetical protein